LVSCGWVAVSSDKRIRYKPNERAAVMLYRVALLIVAGKTPHAELARNFVSMASRVAAFLERHSPPLIAKVYRPQPARTGHHFAVVPQQVKQQASSERSTARQHPDPCFGGLNVSGFSREL
jgi:hypothetical protein